MKILSLIFLIGAALPAAHFSPALAQQFPDTGLPPPEAIIDSIKQYRVLPDTKIFRYNQSGIVGVFEIYQNDTPFVVEIKGQPTSFDGAFFVDVVNLGTGNRDEIWGGVNVPPKEGEELGRGVTLEQVQLVRNGEALGEGAIDDFTGSNANYGVAGRDGIIFFKFLETPRDVRIEPVIDPATIPQEVIDRWSASPIGAIILNATTLRAVSPSYPEIPLGVPIDDVPLTEFFNLTADDGTTPFDVSPNPYPFSGFDANFNPPSQYDEVVIPAQCCAFSIFREGYSLDGIPLSAIGLGWNAQKFQRRVDLGDRSDVVIGVKDNEILNGGGGDDLILGRGGDDVLMGGSGFDFIFGGSGDDLLEGGMGFDFLNGGPGDDTLTGGDVIDPGADSIDGFIFNTGRPFASHDMGVDTINNFQSGLDVIILGLNTFTALTSRVGLGFSVTTEYATVTTDEEAEISSAVIVYNSVNGNLFYNPNGSDAGFGRGGHQCHRRVAHRHRALEACGGQFASLPPAPGLDQAPVLDNNNFFLIRRSILGKWNAKGDHGKRKTKGDHGKRKR